MENYSDELVKNMLELIKEHDKKIIDFSSQAIDFCKRALEAQMEFPDNIDPAKVSAITNLYKAVNSAWFK